jgi:hypothetical protein
MRYGLPVLCVIDPSDTREGRRSNLVRVYSRRDYVDELELEGANRWIEAPLVVPGCGGSATPILGKLVVDRKTDSDQLTIRDALDVGHLALMAAGAIHAYNKMRQEAKLLVKSKFLTDLLDVLPLFAFEKDDKKFYRAIAAILSCHLGLGWPQVMLFIVDSSGLKQASCEMALGGTGEPQQDQLRRHLETSFRSLREYVEDALQKPVPNDSLYQAWISDPEKHRIISFARPSPRDGPVAELLALRSTDPWRKIVVADDPWCKEINQGIPRTFLGKEVFAFPLTKSFALDVEFDIEAAPTQPVGVALVGPLAETGGREPPDPQLTRVTLDLLGALIAQRWTSRRIRGMFGVLNIVNHKVLTDSWDRVKHHAEELRNFPHDDDRYYYFQMAAKAHATLLERIKVARTTLKNLQRPFEYDLDFAEFLDEHERWWKWAWGGDQAKPRLCLDAQRPEAPIAVPCDPLILYDVLTCLIQNAVQVAGDQDKDEVQVVISARQFVDRHHDLVEITVEDNAGGVKSEDEPYLFVRGYSGRLGGTGQGLALARTELLMYSGDLKYVPSGARGHAMFQILFHRGEAHVQERKAEVHLAHRG